MTRKAIFFLWMIFSLGASAQVSVSSTVLNKTDHTPVPYASVFLSNTTIGNTTGDNGNFILDNVHPGTYDLVITVIGFEPYRRKITIANDPVTLPAIRITPKINELKEVVIRTNPNRKKYFDWFYETFKDEFLGKTDIAKDCKILNPEVLDIDYDQESNIITATSDGPLEIENNALGYNIQYLLTNFTLKNRGTPISEVNFGGDIHFTAMHGTPQQERRWQKKRQEVYEGSQLDFLRSALADQLEENGFRVWRLAIRRNSERPSDSLIAYKIKLFKQLKAEQGKKYNDSLSYWEKKAGLQSAYSKLINKPLTRDDIIHSTDQNGIFVVVCDSGQLCITYNKRHNFHIPNLAALGNPENTENTLLKFNSPDVFFDANGRVTNPGSISYQGVWGRGRVAWLLPSDYEPIQLKLLFGDTILTRTTGLFAKYSAAHNDERVYLHTDKPNYGFGDTIWYKAYTVIGQKHQPSALSGVLYVELISPADSLVTRQNIPLVSGIGWSDIPLPVTLKPGCYRVRAYTRWMRNFGADAFDEQRVVIGGVAPVVVKAGEKIDVQFFPEGGELVAGVRSRVAFKAVGINGLGKDIKGTIEDDSGNVVADFTAQHLGMGEFALVSEAGKTYHARINIAGETAFRVDLPKANAIGYTLSVNNNEKDSIYVKVAANDKTLGADKGKTFYLIAQSNGKVYYTTQGKLEKTIYAAAIEKSRFPEGITQFTLFNQSGEPLAERIAFIENKADEISLTLNTNNQIFNTREKVMLNLAAKDGAGRPVTGSFSVAVINETKVSPDENSESTILNNLLLTSELKGYIEQPDYYFTNQTDKTRADLDLLMLTQGYRRYEWKQVLTQPSINTAIQQYPPERMQELTGTITTPAGRAIPHGKVTLLATKQNLVRDTTADENGKFTFADLNITDTATLVVRARKANNGSNVKIKAFVPDYPNVTPAGNITGEIIPADTTRQLSAKTQYNQYRQEQKNDSLKNGKMLNTVTIKAQTVKPKPDMSHSSNLHGGGNADRVIMGKDLGNCINLSDCLTSKLIGISFQKMSVIVDGVNLGVNHINDVNPNEIYSIEVLYSGFAKSIYGSSIARAGALIITLKNGSESAGTDTIKTAGQLHYAQYEQQQKEYLGKNGKLLKTVTIKGIKHPEQPRLQFSSNLNGPGHANQVIMWNQIGDGCINLSDCLQGKLTGVVFSYPMGVEQKRIPYLQRAMGRLSGTPPMTVIIDGIVMDGSHLDDVSPTEIYSIEVLRSGGYLSLYGTNAPGGALIITLKHGNEGTAYFSQAQPNGIMTFPFAGFYKTKAFYTPKYGSPKKDNEQPDIRSTIYWNPNILTDKDGKATLEFYNNDSKGTYRVVVEGIDDDGNLGRKVFRYTVQ